MVGGLVFLGVLVLALIFLLSRPRAAAVSTGPVATNKWDALIGAFDTGAALYGAA